MCIRARWNAKVLLHSAEQDEATRAIVEYSRKVKEDPRVEQVMVPLRDGILVARKK